MHCHRAPHGRGGPVERAIRRHKGRRSVNQELLEKVLSCSRLPSLPEVALRVIDLTARQDVPLREIADTIQADQGLATKILRTVNSPFYGLTRPCSTIHQAQLM